MTHNPIITLISLLVCLTIGATGIRSQDDTKLQKAVEKGTKFLQTRQTEDGEFKVDPPESGAASVECFAVGISALAAMAILSEKGFDDSVKKGVEYLLKKQDKGGLFVKKEAKSYKSAIENGYVLTLLLEIVLQAGKKKVQVDQELLDQISKAIEKGIRTIETLQVKSGAWPYMPSGEWGEHLETATSVAILPALLMAKKAGFKVEEKVIENGLKYIKSMRLDKGFKNETNDKKPSVHVTLGFLHLLQELKGQEEIANILKETLEYATRFFDDGYLTAKKWGNTDPRQMYGFLYTVLYYRKSGDQSQFEKISNDITKNLMSRQNEDGSWNSRYSRAGATALAILTINAAKKDRLILLE